VFLPPLPTFLGRHRNISHLMWKHVVEPNADITISIKDTPLVQQLVAGILAPTGAPAF